MKILLLILAIAAIAMFFNFHHAQKQDEFKTWMAEYKRVYGSEEIEQYRRTIYNQNK